MRRTCLVLGSVLLLSGCSTLFVSKPPLGDGPLPAGTCTTSAFTPFVDGTMAVLFGVSALDIALTDFEDEDAQDARPYAVGASLVLGGALGLSSYRGFRWTSECRARQSMSEEAIADYLRTLSREVAVHEDPG